MNKRGPLRIRRAQDETSVERCVPVLLELRPHLTPADCRRRVLRQMAAGYRLATLERDGQIEAVAGYRLLENLAWNRFLYVDDLVTRSASRDQGLGKRLLTWLLREARRLECAELHLDSGVQRHAAHGFYLRHRLHIVAHHFARVLQ
jgi:GNAT superfamily N-acetyltransferase